MKLPFRPLPLLGNPHVQTVLGNLLKGPNPRLPVEQRRVPLPDGDSLMMHDSRPRNWRVGDPVVLMAHGLGGSHLSGNMVRVTGMLFPRGIRVARLDLRGAGAGAALARRTYDAACSEDVRAAAEMIHHETPTSPLFLVGFSLGGNIVLKLAGEAARKPLPALTAVAAMNPPIHLERCAAMLAKAPFYDRFFVNNLLRQLRKLERLHPELPRARFPRNLSLRMFDDLYTAPKGGYLDAMDYYRKAAAFPLMSDIAIPTFVLTAADDPFVDVAPFHELPAVPHRDVHIVERGGHLGFLGWDGAGGFRWAERRLVDWLLALAIPHHKIIK